MITSLSVLIPVYNRDCTQLVCALQRQAVSVEGLRFEILVGDDGSTQEELKAVNRVINQWQGCRVIECSENAGRAVIRNLLAKEARGEYLLFLDSNVSILRDDFLLRYVQQGDNADVVVGGYELTPTAGYEMSGNLRYRYELSCSEANGAEERARHPYMAFISKNFVICRSVMLQCPFDERIRRYGYEDVLLGKQLMQAKARVIHIDNPVGFCTFESNAVFLQKTEDALLNLATLKDDMRGFTHLQSVAESLQRKHLDKLLLFFYSLFRPMLRHILLHQHPNVKFFNVYRLFLYLKLCKKNKTCIKKLT